MLLDESFEDVLVGGGGSGVVGLVGDRRGEGFPLLKVILIIFKKNYYIAF